MHAHPLYHLLGAKAGLEMLCSSSTAPLKQCV